MLLSLFHTFVPRQDNAFWPLTVRINGTARLLLVFLSSSMWKSDSLTNRSLRYFGARSFRDLYVIVDVSFTIISLTDSQPRSLRKGSEGAS